MNIRHFATIGLVVAALAGCEPRPESTVGGPNATEPDNTARNAQDRQADAKTPFDQAENGADIATTAAIRREILKTDGLSTNADNIKIMTANGVVTLRGVVASDAERETVRAIATRIAGAPDKVDVQLMVDPDGDKPAKVDGDRLDDRDRLDDDKADEKLDDDRRDPIEDPTRNR